MFYVRKKTAIKTTMEISLFAWIWPSSYSMASNEAVLVKNAILKLYYLQCISIVNSTFLNEHIWYSFIWNHRFEYYQCERFPSILLVVHLNLPHFMILSKLQPRLEWFRKSVSLGYIACALRPAFDSLGGHQSWCRFFFGSRFLLSKILFLIYSYFKYFANASFYPFVGDEFWYVQ